MAKSLYDRLGGIFAIAALVDEFSDALLNDPVAGRNSKNPRLRDWHKKTEERLPGLKWMRTLWLADVAGGPYKFEATRPGKKRLGLEEAHRKLRISPEEFDAVAKVLSKTLDKFDVPKKDKAKVLGAFADHKNEVTAGHRERENKPRAPRQRTIAERAQR